MPTNHTIQINVNIDEKGNANFSYWPAVQRVYDDDTVQWASRDGLFAIQFKDDTPVEKLDARACRVEGRDGDHDKDDRPVFATQPVRLRDDARGHYHYAVAIVVNNAVYLDSACPEIVAN
jgi:hypothetical protein